MLFRHSLTVVCAVLFSPGESVALIYYSENESDSFTTENVESDCCVCYAVQAQSHCCVCCAV